MHARRRKNPLKDYKARQAIALSLDRQAIVKTLFNNFADVGNDSTFAPVYPSTDKSVPQRHKDITTAKKLMAQAGHPRGLQDHAHDGEDGRDPAARADHPAVGEGDRHRHGAEHRDVDGVLRRHAGRAAARLGQHAVAQRPDEHHRLGPPGGAERLPHGGVQDEGHLERGALLEQEVRLALKSFLAAIALKDQQKYEKQMQEILLHDTPVIVPYFYNFLAAGSKKVTGYKADAQGTVFLSHTSLA